jgi:hypothetical protein
MSNNLLLFDYDYLLNKNINLELNFNNNDGHKAIILQLKKPFFDKAITLETENRLNFLKNNLKSNIISYYPFFFNKNKKQIILYKSSKFFFLNIESILKILYQNFPHNYKILIYIPLNDPQFSIKSKLISNYFSYPLISGLNYNVYFFTYNNLEKKLDSKTNLFLLKRLMTDYQKMIDKSHSSLTIPCYISIKFDNKTIKDLQLLPNKVFDDTSFKGLEISDRFRISEISSKNNSTIITLSLPHHNNHKIGDDDSVDVVFSKYTFHTHPKKTYDKFEVLFAWPSWQDFESFLILYKNGITLLHLVSTIEGAYIIRINQSFIPFLNKLNDQDIRKIIKKFYDINYPSYDIERKNNNHKVPENPQDFIEKINKLEIKLNNKKIPKIFFVDFFEWKNLNENIEIPINYLSGSNQSCSISDIQMF